MGEPARFGVPDDCAALYVKLQADGSLATASSFAVKMAKSQNEQQRVLDAASGARPPRAESNAAR